MDWIHELIGTRLEPVIQLPNLDTSISGAFYGKMFYINDKLHVTNGYNVWVVSDKLELVKITDWCIYIQWCDKTLCFYPGIKVTMLNSDYTETLVTALVQGQTYFAGVFEAVAVFHNEAADTAVVVDMISAQSHEVDGNQFKAERIMTNLRLGSGGLCFSEPLLNIIKFENQRQRASKHLRDFVQKWVAHPMHDPGLEQILFKITASNEGCGIVKPLKFGFEKYSGVHELIGVFKIKHNVFGHFYDNKFRIIDQNRLILFETQSNMPLKPMMSGSTKYGDKKMYVYYPQWYQPVFGNGRYYMQVLDNIYEITGTQITLLGTIPDCTKSASSSFYGRIFCAKNQLFVTNGYKTYKYDGQDFVQVKEHAWLMHFQFNDNVIVYYSGDKICRLNNDGTEDTLVELTADFKYFSCALGGVAIFHNEYAKKSFVVNMLDFRIKSVENDQSLYNQAILGLIELQDCGLSLSNVKLTELFGSEFIAERDAAVSEYQRRMEAHNGYEKATNKFFCELVTSENRELLISERQKEIEKRFVKTHVTKRELTYVIPIYNNPGLFAIMYDNQFVVINQNRKILFQCPCSCKIHTMMSDNHRFCDNSTYIYYTQWYQPLFVKGQVFLQLLDRLYKFTGTDIQEVGQFTDLRNNSSASFYGKVFCLNDEIYLSNGYHLFKQVGNDFIHQKKTEWVLHFQFCNNVLSYYTSTRVCKVNNDLSEEKIIDLDPEVKYIAFVGGGVAIFHVEGGQKVVIINMVDMSSHVTFMNQKNMLNSNILDILELQPCGLSLSDSKLVELFGAEFVDQRNDMWLCYINQQQQHYSYDKKIWEQLNQLIANQNPELMKKFQNYQKSLIEKSTLAFSMMFMCFPIIGAPGYVGAFEQNTMFICNSKREIIRRISIDLDLYMYYKNDRYVGGSAAIFYVNWYNQIQCKGQNFIQYFEKIFKITSKGLTQYCDLSEIIDLSATPSFYGRFFAFKDQLYFSTGYKLYRLAKDQSPQYVQDSMWSLYFQFCNTVIVYHTNVSIAWLQDDLSEQEICKLDGDTKFMGFSGAGVCVFHNDDCLKAWVVDMVQKKYQVVDDHEELVHVNCIYQCETCVAGLSIKQQILNKIFNYNFGQERDEAYIKWAKQQQEYKENDGSLAKLALTVEGSEKMNTIMPYHKQLAHEKYNCYRRKIIRTPQIARISNIFSKLYYSTIFMIEFGLQ